MTKRNNEIKESALSLLLMQKGIEGEYALCFINYLALKTGRPDIHIGKYGEYAKSRNLPHLSDGISGTATKYNGQWYLMYDERDYPSFLTERTIVHEVAHALLNHDNPPTEEQENEAELFADEFIMPECVIRYLLSPPSENNLSAYFPAEESEINRRVEAVKKIKPHSLSKNEEKLLKLLFGKIIKPKEKTDNV